MMENGTEQIYLIVDESDAGSRLDNFVSRQLSRTSRSKIQRWIAAERITVDGFPKKPSYTLNVGQEVEVQPKAPEPSTLVPENLPLDILYEDKEIVVLNKPAGQVVHPGAGNKSGTLANALLFHFQEISRQESIRPGLIHRLDKGTSGVLIVAKTESAHGHISAQFQSREVEKKYLALVLGETKSDSGRIDIAIGRDTRSRTKISTRTAKPREAVTLYRVLQRLKGFTYLEVYPKTGRTHQIRVHLYELGHPVVGDDTYLRKSRLNNIEPEKRRLMSDLDRLFLHATSIRITHPSSEKQMTFHVPLPDELANFLQTLGE